MATLPGLIVTLVDGAWQLALLIIPPLYLWFLGYALTADGHDIGVSTVVHSQHTYARYYGVYAVLGLLVGGISVAGIGGAAGTGLGAAAAAAAILYGAMERERPETAPIDMTTWHGRLALGWLLIPVAAVAALMTGNALLQSGVALVFLSTVFWEV